MVPNQQKKAKPWIGDYHLATEGGPRRLILCPASPAQEHWKGRSIKSLSGNKWPGLETTLLLHQPEHQPDPTKDTRQLGSTRKGVSPHAYSPGIPFVAVGTRPCSPTKRHWGSLAGPTREIPPRLVLSTWSLFFPIGLRMPSITESHQVALASPQPGLSQGSALHSPQAGWSGLRCPAWEVLLIFTGQRFSSFNQRYQVGSTLEKPLHLPQEAWRGSYRSPMAPGKPSRPNQQHKIAPALKIK